MTTEGAAPAGVAPAGHGRTVVVLRVVLAGLLITLAVGHLPRVGAVIPPWLQSDVAFAVAVDATILIALRAARRRFQRPMWTLFAIGMVCNTVGTAYNVAVLENSGIVTSVSIADVWWLWYPAIYLGIILTVGAHAGHTRYQTLLDGAAAGLGAAAIFSQVVIESVFEPGQRDLPITTLGYPVGDSMLVAAVLCVLAAAHRRDRRVLGLIAVGVLIYTVADTGWLALASHDRYTPGSIVDLVFSVSGAVIAWAAWVDEPPSHAGGARADGDRLILPVVFAFAALGQLLLATRRHAPMVSICLDALTLFAVLIRGVVSFRHANDLGAARHREARLDELTGLPNRRAYHEHLATLVGQRPTPALAVLLLDLDRFKEVNDSFGHHVGDRLLRDTAERLRGLVRPHDFLARLGGDEFVIVLSGGVIADAHLRLLADRVCTGLRQTVDIDGHQVQVDVSIGISSSADAQEDAETLLRHADIAMYRAKKSRQGHLVYAVGGDLERRQRPAMLEPH